MTDPNDSVDHDLLEAMEEDPAAGLHQLDFSEIVASGSGLVNAEMTPQTFLEYPTQYLILTQSGKPVFSLHGSETDIAEYMGVIQALVACFDEDSPLQSFRAKNTLFVFNVAPPLILVAIDKLQRSVSQLHNHLEILRAQILSTLTQSQLARAYASRPSIDLRPLLAGTEVYLDALAKSMNENNPGIWLNALESLELRRSVRDKLNAALLDCRTPNLLYGMIVADHRLVSVVRPKKHSLHPPDLYLVFSMLFNGNAFREGEHWVPICLPRFNAGGFLYAYFHFIAPNTAVVLISPDRTAFFEMQEIHKQVWATLESQNTLAPIEQAVEKGRIQTAALKVPVVQHFVYKSRANVQFVQSSGGTQFEEQEPRRLLWLAYTQLQAYMQRTGLRICCMRYGSTTVLGWSTPAFELYCATGPVSKDALSLAVRDILAWLRKHEERLFIVSGATF